jgi:hypothetical protein
MWFERVLGGPDPHTTIHAGIFITAEYAVPKKISSSVDLIARLVAEGKIQGSVKGPVDLTSEVAVGANPTLEVRSIPFLKKLEFGPKATVFLEFGYEDNRASVKAGVNVEGAVTGHF